MLSGLEAVQELVTHGAPNHERLLGVTPPCCSVDNPMRSMHETQVLQEVVTQSREVDEGCEVPEATASPALEQTFTDDAIDRFIRSPVVRPLGAVRFDAAETLEAARLATFCVGEDARVGPGVDQQAAWRKNSVHLV
jgi:hypothetical protein